MLGGLNTNGVNTGTLGSVSGQYGCCGDKASEQFAQCGSDDSDAVCSTINSYKRVCCDAATDCVDANGNCVNAGEDGTFGGHKSYCKSVNGKGVWQDPDTSSSFCAVATGDSNNYIYSSGSDQNRCCGDDPGETWGIPSADTNGHLACCNGNVVDANSYCESPINKWLFLDHDPVSYITSSDYRVTSVPSRSNSGGWNANACTGTSANGKVCAKTNTASGMGICIGTTCYSNVVAGIHITYESVSQGTLFHPAVVYGASLASGCTYKNEVCDSNVNSDGFGFKATGYCAGLGGNCIACGTENANSCYDGFDADCDGRVSCEDSTCRDDNHLCTAGDKCKTPPGGGSKRCVASPNTCIAYVGVGWQEFSSGDTHTVSGTQYYCNGGDWIDDPDDAPAFCTAAGHTSIFMVGGSNKCCGDDGGSTDTFIGLVQACCQGTVVNQGDYAPACGGTLYWDSTLLRVAYQP